MFRDFSLLQLQYVLNASRVMRYDPGQTIYLEGHPCEGMLIVLEGEVGVFRNGKNCTTLEPGAIAEELSLISDRPATRTHRATIPTRVLIVERETLRRVVRQHPRFGNALLGQLANRLVEAIENRL